MTSERLGKYIDFKGISFYEFENSIGCARGTISKAVKEKKSIGSNILENILTAYKDLNPNWLISGLGSMIKNSNYTVGENFPIMVSEPASAGYGAGDFSGDNSFSPAYYNIPEIKGRADYLIRVKGNSMEPKYFSGDVLACKKVTIQDFFQWNRSYVLDTTQGPLLKRVKKSANEGCILLVSENKEFDPFEISLSEVRSLGLIVALIRVE
jgi:SOS-response transcriptional repressor LexA